MKMTVSVEDMKGYMTVYRNALRIYIKKINGKNHLVIYHYGNAAYRSTPLIEEIPLSEVRLAYMRDIKDDELHEYFRYEK